MTKAEIIALAERVEGAEGLDRELDRLIAFATGWRMRDGDWIEPRGFRLPIGTLAVPPFYTASLDAAMTLVPDGEGHWPQLIYTGTNPNNPAKQRVRYEIWAKGYSKPARGHAATPALALTSASLRAIAEEMD